MTCTGFDELFGKVLFDRLNERIIFCRNRQSSTPVNVNNLSGSLTFVIEDTNDRTSETETCVFHVLVI